ncbi:MAG: PDZ domain-containing protein [Gemmataceae bacterium]|nr:PDZ domain-containing protein [Gemmataceae bacterium]
MRFSPPLLLGEGEKIQFELVSRGHNVNRTLLAVLGLSISLSPAIAFPKLSLSAKKPPEFLGVNEAATTKTRIAPAGTAGTTSFLGISVETDAKGQLVVEAIVLKSPAEAAGVKLQDVVTHIAGNPVRAPIVFREWVQSFPPGEVVKIALVRDGKPLEIMATLEPASRPRKPSSAYLGLSLGDAKEGEGARVELVAAESPAAAAGLKVGDMVLKLNGEELKRSGMLADLVQERLPGDAISFLVKREGKELPVITAKVAAQRPMQKGGGRGPIDASLALWKNPELRVALVGIDFTDIKHNDKNTSEELEKLFIMRSGNDSKGQPSLNDYFHEVSSGAFQLKKEGKNLNWAEVSKKRADYSQGTGVSNKTAVLVEALDKLVARDGKTVLDNLDAILFVYAGEPVRTNAGAVYFPHAGVLSHQQKRYPYLFVPEGGAKLSSISVFAKEACKLLGLPDLAARSENVGSEGLGNWCVLSDVRSASKPQHLSTWGKERIGWLTPTVIDPTVRQKLVLNPVRGSKRECFKVLVRPDGSEYLLLENRTKSGFDSDLPGEGLLIWRVMNGRPTLIESHGIEGPKGPTESLTLVPYPSAANTGLTPHTFPSSRSPQGGGLPIHITNIKRLADGKVTFQIGYEYE